jgi:hypothetical protein
MGTKNSPGAYDCYAKLEPDEPHFVLMGRDASGAAIVRKWAEMREQMLSDTVLEAKAKGASAQDILVSEHFKREGDKISEAYACADAMEDYCRSLGKLPRAIEP